MDFNADGKKDLMVGDSDGFLYIAINEGTDAAPILGKLKNIQVAGRNFQCESKRAKPAVVDWNNDGKIDILVGRESGTICLLLNTGTPEEPKFDKTETLMIGDKPLAGGMRTDVAVADLNGDGKKDIVCANESAAINYFENVGTDAAPVFEKSVTLQAKGSPIEYRVGNRIRTDFDGDGKPVTVYQDYNNTVTMYGLRRPLQTGGRDWKVTDGKIRLCVTDWNNDGKKDMLYAKEDGTVYLLVNTTDQEPPVFEEAIQLKDGGNILNGGLRNVPEIADQNKDGKKDLICYRQDDKIRVYLNQGTDEAPVFNGYTDETIEQSPICGGYRSRIEVTDWNNDGLPDLVYGVESFWDKKGRIYIYLQEK